MACLARELLKARGLAIHSRRFYLMQGVRPHTDVGDKWLLSRPKIKIDNLVLDLTNSGSPVNQS